jgi:hypothetical protein
MKAQRQTGAKRPRLTATTRRKPEVKTGAPVLPFSFPNLDARQSAMRGRMSGYGTSETNGNDARRSACRSNPDIGWRSVKDRL